MINYYRLDKKSFNDVYGGKAQIAYEICKKEKGIVTCGSRVLSFFAFKAFDRKQLPLIIDTDRIVKLQGRG